MKKFNILVICGPTACGKTSLAVSLALRYNGEIISGDSRQVFRGMDIGTGKDINEYNTLSGDVKYHLIDIADPMEEYNLYRYLQDFRNAFKIITGKGKLPVLAGGSGLYIEAALKNYSLPPAPEDHGLRRELEDKPRETLIQILQNESIEIFRKTDLSSTRRIIRGIEIARYMNENPEESGNIPVEILLPLIIGINLPRNELLKRIDSRLESRLEKGMVDEVKSLLEKGVTHTRLDKLGLEYRYCSMYLRGHISYKDMVEKLKTEIHRFSKRQMTWLRGMEKRGLSVNWVVGNSPDEAVKVIGPL
jgi:tRNA dimethylallyltransferase